VPQTSHPTTQPRRSATYTPKSHNRVTEVRGSYASLSFGDVRLGLARATDLAGSRPIDPGCRSVPAGAEMVVEVRDVRALRDTVAARGIPLAEDVQQRPWGLTDFRVHDPDGYYWRFTSRR
jgi:lactoylglutathione lyase